MSYVDSICLLILLGFFLVGVGSLFIFKEGISGKIEYLILGTSCFIMLGLVSYFKLREDYNEVKREQNLKECHW